MIDRNRFFQTDNVYLHAGRSRLAQQGPANLIVKYIVIADNYPLGVGDF